MTDNGTPIIEVAKPRLFTFTIPESELAILTKQLVRTEDDLRYSYDDVTGADIVKAWVGKFQFAMNPCKKCGGRGMVIRKRGSKGNTFIEPCVCCCQKKKEEEA